MTVELKQTTREEAIEALSIVETTYGRFGYEREIHEARLIDLLLERHSTIAAAKRTADKFRNTLWSIVAGGGVSASTTKKVYAALGRSEEADIPWI